MRARSRLEIVYDSCNYLVILVIVALPIFIVVVVFCLFVVVFRLFFCCFFLFIYFLA